MDAHDWTNGIFVVYAHASKLRDMAISDGVTEDNVDVRQEMEDIMYKLDMLSKKLANKLTKEKV